MARVSPILTNFTAGEISDRLLGRVDLARYANAAREITNFIVLPYGGVTRRPGTRFIYETKAVTGQYMVRLVPFVFNETQAYVLEFGHNYIRFYYDQGILMDGATPPAPYEVTTTITAAQLHDLRFSQSADVLYIAHPNRAPQKLSRTGHTTWTIANVSFTSTPGEWTGTNYPGAVAFFEQRLWWGGTPGQPGKVWASVSGSYEDLTTGVDDDDALAYTIASGQVDQIRWMEPHKRLIIGTLGEEWSAGASSSLDPITPTNVRFERETTHGSAGIQGRIINNALVYVGVHGGPVFESTFDINLDSFKGVPLSLLAGHMFGDQVITWSTRSSYGIKEWDYRGFPESILWFVKNDGGLIACTYNRNEEVIAWHQHDMGGVAVNVLSVACIPGAKFYDEVWLAIKRTVDGASKVYIELMEIGHLGESEQHAFLDSSLTYSGAATTTLSGLSHLEGKTVQVYTSQGVHPDRVVTSGAISLEWSVTNARVGLGYTSILRTLPLEAGAQDGTAQGKVKRIHKVAIRFYKTIGGKVGTAYIKPPSARTKAVDTVTTERMEQILFREPADLMGAEIDAFSGDKVLTIGSNYDREGGIWIVQDQPLPMTVLAVMPQMTANDL